MQVTTMGIDLAKQVFQVHGIDTHGAVVLKKRLTRSALHTFMANLPPCRVGMEVSGGANYWSRRFRAYGHDVRLMSPQFVKPYVKSNKNDCNDAEAICEAVSRPTMRFVAPKTVAQQDLQGLHRICQRLAHVNGVGPLIATAMVAAVSDPHAFKNGRQLAAWLGLVPRQRSSGNTHRLLGISKRGDRYLRTLLIHGARAVVARAPAKTDSRSRWIVEIQRRRGTNRTCVAVANKNARILWALMAKGEPYRQVA